MWRWWALRSDRLVPRLQVGFTPFAQRDMALGCAQGSLVVPRAQVPPYWRIIVWMMVGSIHDIVVGHAENEEVNIATEAIMRLVGLPPDRAASISHGPLPAYPEPHIDFTFALTDLDAPGRG